ncbi:rhodanese-like domain-containing protein [Kitasatospora sp. NPDC057223]|uniref:rhodanese-like domain-containing protein n=1 Tax=Kitasatospora sp. NPDC057223 TaxID=3346055 RepID=UPI003633CDFF
MTAQSPVRWSDPEQQQLEERVAATELAWLTLDVDVQTLRVEIDNFALIHHQLLGPLYARLDELDALIAEAVAARSGDPEDARRAADARRQVDELPDLESLFADIADVREQQAVTPPEAPARVRPGKDAQRIYRDLARRAHPDLSTDPAEQQRRSAFIARVNEAYAYGDTRMLEQLAEEWSTDPEAAPALDSPDRLGWLHQRLEWLGGKIAEVAAEQVRLENTAMGELLALSPQDPDRLLEELAEQLLAKAAAQQDELARLLAGRGAHRSAHPHQHQTQETQTMFAQIPATDAASVPADAALLDVREQDEWDAGHVDGALHIPIGEVVARIGELPGGPLYVICRVGGRSAQVVQYLVQQGHEAVNVDGGMLSWDGAGRPMVSGGSGEPFVL